MIAWTCGRFTALALTLAVATPLGAEASRGSRHAGYYTSGRAAARVMYEGVSQYSHYRSAYRGGYSSGGLQCVPFARENTGIELAGNAANWWDNAAGVYERGSRPEVGSIMNFRATGRMRMGHVAVVSNVIDARNVQIDHANWSGRGVVTRNVTVVDVSPGNDWSEVRVALGTGDFGSVYPTYGFIYDRPDKGTMIANTSVVRGASVAASAPLITASLPQVNPVTIDLRPAAARTAVLLAPRDEEAADDSSGVRARRWGGRALPVVTYGRGSFTQVARFGRAEPAYLRRGEMMAAHYGRAGDRLMAGRMMGGQVLFIGHGPIRGTQDAGTAHGGRAYAGLVRTVSARAPQSEQTLGRATPARGHAEPAKRRGRHA